MKGKKRGLNREIVTLGGLKKQETAMKRKCKRKMNQLRGKAGFPASRKADNIKPLQDTPVSVVFVDNTKGGKLANILKEEENRLGRVTGYNIRVAEMAGRALSRLLPSTNPWGQETVAGRTAQCVTRGMKRTRIARKGIFCMIADTDCARWMERMLES